MEKLVNLTTQDGVAVITINNPPVNALSPGVPEGLVAALDAAEKDHRRAPSSSLAAEARLSPERTSRSWNWRPRGGEAGHRSFTTSWRASKIRASRWSWRFTGRRSAAATKSPWPGTIGVAVPDAQIGQPEVNLGIIPGAEGTQRLPRLVGVAAVDLCVSGKPIRAPEALKLGLIDRVIEGDLLTGAIAFRPRDRRSRRGSAQDARADRQAGFGVRGCIDLRGWPRSGSQDAPQYDRAAQSRGRNRGRRQLAVR